MKKDTPKELTPEQCSDIAILFFDQQNLLIYKRKGISLLDTEHLSQDREIQTRARKIHDFFKITNSHEREILSPPWWTALLRKVREQYPTFSLPVEIIPKESQKFWGSLLLKNDLDEKQLNEKPYFSEANHLR